MWYKYGLNLRVLDGRKHQWRVQWPYILAWNLISNLDMIRHLFNYRGLIALMELDVEKLWSLSPFLPFAAWPPPPRFHLQSNICSWGEAQDAWVSSQLFIEQYQVSPEDPHLFLFESLLIICWVSIVRTTALHLPQLALQQRIHSTSERLFLPRVTAEEDCLVSALSAVFNFFVHSFKNDFSGSSVPSLYDSSGA